MKEKISTISAWDDENKSSSIDVTNHYYQLCNYFNIKSFKNLSDNKTQSVMKKILNDYQNKKISLEEVGALSAFLYDESKIFESQNENWEEIMMRMEDLNFTLKDNPKAAHEDIINAINYLSKPDNNSI